MDNKAYKLIQEYFESKNNKFSSYLNVHKTIQRNVFNYVCNKLGYSRDGLSFQKAMQIFIIHNNIDINNGDSRLSTLVNIYLNFENEYLNGYKDICNTPKWIKLRNQVFKKYGYKCMKCGYEDKSNHIDHIKPKSKFPELKFDFDNLQVLCKLCNFEKSNRLIIDYRNT